MKELSKGRISTCELHLTVSPWSKETLHFPPLCPSVIACNWGRGWDDVSAPRRSCFCLAGGQICRDKARSRLPSTANTHSSWGMVQWPSDTLGIWRRHQQCHHSCQWNIKPKFLVIFYSCKAFNLQNIFMFIISLDTDKNTKCMAYLITIFDIQVCYN